MAMHASTGDEIVIDSTEVGMPPRRGTILEVRSEPDHEHYVVRWGDGHESIFYPASTAHVVHPGTPS
jgi:Domain of unknown function (DUF1918)